MSKLKSRKKTITGIDHHPGRIQPFTVWCARVVVWFAYTYDEAERKLKEAILLKEDADATSRKKAQCN